MDMLVRFILYGLLGWIAEILFTGSYSMLSGSVKLSGQTYLWMFPIYGLAVFLEPMRKQMRTMPWPVRGTIWAGTFFIIEYLSGWLLRAAIGVCPWDYSQAGSLALDGLIRLDYFPVWFTAGLIYERLCDFLVRAQLIYYGEADREAAGDS
jgi:uncharacterized membrane protein